MTSPHCRSRLANFRILTSVYEAITIHRQLECGKKDMDYLPLWFLYCIAAMNSLLVSCTFWHKADNQLISPPQVINASSNFLIYLFAGVSFRSKFQEVFRLSKCTSLGNNGLRQDYQTNSATRYKRFLRKYKKWLPEEDRLPATLWICPASSWCRSCPLTQVTAPQCPHEHGWIFGPEL